MRNDETLKLNFNKMPFVDFWNSVEKEYPQIPSITILFSFSTTCLCEQSFSTLVLIKNDKRSSLKGLDELRVAFSNIEPNMNVYVHQNKLKYLINKLVIMFKLTLIK